MLNRFLGKAYAGRSGTSEVVIATLFTWGAYLFVGGVPMVILMMISFAQNPDVIEVYANNPMDLSTLGIAPFPMFVALMLSFVIGMGGLALGLRKMQARKIQSVMTGFAKVRWKRMFAGLAVWMLLSGAGTIYNYFMHPGSVIVNPDAHKLLWFAVPALILIPIQSAFEEMMIRGQLLQNFGRVFRTPMVPLILTSLIFALLHGMNNEIAAFGFFSMMLFYFSFGFSLGAIALMDEGLEIPIGIHVGNNLFAFLFVTYPGSSLETPSFFMTTSMDVGDMWQFYVSMVIVLMIFFGKRMDMYRALFKNEPITPYS